MGDNQKKHPARVEIDPELDPAIEEYIELEHRGTKRAAVNALILRGLNAWRGDKPQTTQTPG